MLCCVGALFKEHAKSIIDYCITFSNSIFCFTKVRLGDHDISMETETTTLTQKTIKVAKIIIHENYGKIFLMKIRTKNLHHLLFSFER